MSNDPRGPGDGPPASRRGGGEQPEARPAPAPQSRRTATLRMPAVSVGPPSRPSGAESETSGRIHRIVKWLDANRGAFSLSRMIMQTGVDLRAFGAETKDDPRVVTKLWSVLDGMLTPEERESLLRAVREGG